MGIQKFMIRVAGVAGFSEKYADQVGGSAASAGNIPALDPNGRLPQTMMPAGVGPDTDQIVAAEALAAGAFVSVFPVAGTPNTDNVRNADGSTTGKTVDGYVLAPVAKGATATVYFNGANNVLTGLTPGADYWLSTTTPGAAVTGDPATSGQTSQYLGKATSATTLNFTRAPATIIA